jgi:hypothetical protein
VHERFYIFPVFVDQGPFVFAKLESISVPQENCIFIIGGEYLTKTITHVMSDIDGKPYINVYLSTKSHKAYFKISQIQTTSIETCQSVGRNCQSLKRREWQRKKKVAATMSKPQKMKKKKMKKIPMSHMLTTSKPPILI